MARCIYCGAELPERAAFCPHCAKSQVPKVSITPPKPVRRHRRVWLVFFLAWLVALGSLFCLRNLPLRSAETDPEFTPTTEAPVTQPEETAAAQPKVAFSMQQGTRAGHTAQYSQGNNGYLEYLEYYSDWKWAYHLVSMDGGMGYLERFDENGNKISTEEVENAAALVEELVSQWD